MYELKLNYNPEWQEYSVQVWENGKRSSELDYFADSAEDAFDTMLSMAKTLPAKIKASEDTLRDIEEYGSFASIKAKEKERKIQHKKIVDYLINRGYIDKYGNEIGR